MVHMPRNWGMCTISADGGLPSDVCDACLASFALFIQIAIGIGIDIAPVGEVASRPGFRGPEPSPVGPDSDPDSDFDFDGPISGLCGAHPSYAGTRCF